MAGITDSPTRRIARRFGAGLLYSECISAEGLRRLGKTSLDYCRFKEDERPIAIQLFGSAPEPLAEAAAVVADRFAPDMIDINCGCPVKKFVTKGCGGALMETPQKIGQIVAAVSMASRLPVSAKLRVGYWPGVETAVEAARIAVDSGAALVAVHGRYVRKAKGTLADWSSIARVREAIPSTPFIGNGDVFTRADAVRMIAETGCDRVMIARGAQGRPWIFAEINDPNGQPYQRLLAEQIGLLIEHYYLMIDHFGEKTAMLRMRKQFGWFTHGWPAGAKLRDDIMKIVAFNRLKERLGDYLNDQGDILLGRADPHDVGAMEDEED